MYDIATKRSNSEQESSAEIQIKVTLHQSSRFDCKAEKAAKMLHMVSEFPHVVSDNESANNIGEEQKSQHETLSPKWQATPSMQQPEQKECKTNFLKIESRREETKLDSSENISPDKYYNKSLESKIDILNDLLDEQSREIQLIDMRLEDAKMDTIRLQNSIRQLHAQEDQMKDKIELFVSTELKEAKNKEEKLREKIMDFTRIRDTSITNRSDRIDEVLTIIRELEGNNSKLKNRYKKMKKEEIDIDIQIKNAFRETVELKSRMSTGELMKAQFITFLSDVYNNRCEP